MVLAACGETPDDSLAIARRALADGLWSVADTNAQRAAESELLRQTARLVQLEALAGAGRTADIVARASRWQPATDGVRYWHAWALVRDKSLGDARQILSAPFEDPLYARLALRLSARLETEAGDRNAADEMFRSASEALPSNSVARTENAIEWAKARESAGDVSGARKVLSAPDVLDFSGAAGDDARLLAANLAMRAADTNMAQTLFRRLVDGGTNTSERAYVLAACALVDSMADTPSAPQAIAFASNAFARASAPDLVQQAGYRLGFSLFGQPATRPDGMRLISKLLHSYPGTTVSRAAHQRFADDLLSAGDAAAAAGEYEALQQAYPEHALDAKVLAGRGWAMLALGRRMEAVGLFARAAQVATNLADRATFTFKQADGLLADGRYGEAAEVYARVSQDGGLELAERARFQQADALARAGRQQESIAMFERVLAAGGRLAMAAGIRAARLESAAGLLERAIERYNKLLATKNPEPSEDQRVDILIGRGKSLYGAYRFEEAEKDFAAVAGLRPSRKNEMAFLSALCLYGAGKDADAALAARELLKTAEPVLRAEVVFWLAQYDYGHREYSAARSGFADCATNAHLSAGRRIEALGRAARCCAAQSDYAGVVDFATRATTNAVAVKAIAQPTAETPAVAEAFILQGEALMEMARFSEAVLVLARAQLLASAPPELLRRAALLKADCLFAMGADDDRRYLQALDAYRALLRDEQISASQRLAVSFKVGRSLEKLGRRDEAADQYYVHVLMAYCDGIRAKTWFDGDARAFFTRAAFILADYYEARGEGRQAVRVLDYLVKTGVPAAREARRRIERLDRKGGVW